MSVRTRRRRRTFRTAPGPSHFRTAVLILFTLGILSVLTGGLGVAAAYSYYTQDLPSPDKLRDRQVFRTTKILDRNGRLLYELFDPQGGKRTNVRLSDVSPHLVQATIAIEDASFYDNPGFNVRGIFRSALSNLQGEEIQGGSSITQQLIKRVLLSPEVTYERKIRELILAYRVSQHYSKDQILEWYLNEIHYGGIAYGIEAAAESYFGKSSRDLSLAESAMLAGLPQAPSLLSPLVDPSAGGRRQRMVLDAMVRQEFITERQAEEAANQPLDYQPMQGGIEAPHFVMYVRDLLERRYGTRLLYSGGLTVHTSIDLDMQKIAERIARQQVAKLTKDSIHNAAVVAMRPSTGEILVMLGSVDYFNRAIHGQVNIAISDRQPGSTFKPITYAAAFMKGLGPGTVILDNFTVFRDRNNQPYTPSNVDKLWHGPVTIRTALANSMNIPAVKAIEFVGVQNAIALAHKMGITSLDPGKSWDLSITLGGGEVKLLDLVYAYSAFANGGILCGQPVPPDRQGTGRSSVEPVAILKVEDADGKILEEYAGAERVEVLKPQISYLVTHILSDNDARTPLFGPNSPLKLTRPSAAKTGTTDSNRDLWTVGYTPDLVTGVWVGNSDNQEIAQVLTTLTAAPIWQSFMEEVLAGTAASEFEQPGGLEKIAICRVSGLLPDKHCPTTVTELFVKGTAPTKQCDIHRLVVVDKTTGYLATAATPPENREERVVEVFPPDWASWAKAAGKPEPPQPPPDQGQAGQPMESRDANSALIIRAPTTGSPVGGTVEIQGTASGRAFASYRVEYGEGMAPTSWRAVGGVHSMPVENGVLERWDTRSLNGLYKLRITLTEHPPALPSPIPSPTIGAVSPMPALSPAPTPAPSTVRVLEVPVIVDNVPPTVSLTSPKDGSSFQRAQMERITITAQVSDNHRLARTEFYVNDRLVDSTTSTPATIEWPASGGTHVIRAVARDAAGNETRSGDVKIVVR